MQLTAQQQVSMSADSNTVFHNIRKHADQV